MCGEPCVARVIVRHERTDAVSVPCSARLFEQVRRLRFLGLMDEGESISVRDLRSLTSTPALIAIRAPDFTGSLHGNRAGGQSDSLCRHWLLRLRLVWNAAARKPANATTQVATVFWGRIPGTGLENIVVQNRTSFLPGSTTRALELGPPTTRAVAGSVFRWVQTLAPQRLRAGLTMIRLKHGRSLVPADRTNVHSGLGEADAISPNMIERSASQWFHAGYRGSAEIPTSAGSVFLL